MVGLDGPAEWRKQEGGCSTGSRVQFELCMDTALQDISLDIGRERIP